MAEQGRKEEIDESNVAGGRNGESGNARNLQIYPLNRYYFGSKDAIPDKDATFVDRIQRLRANYAARGMRTYVEAVLLVELFQHPHVLLLQVKNSYFKLPGGRLRIGESDTQGLKRKLSRNLSPEGTATNVDWQVGECIGKWWRLEFENLPFPYFPPTQRRPKECTKLFLVRLPMYQQFIVPKNMKLLAVPLYQLHDNSKTYGPIISGIPYLLSKFSINVIKG